jgi:hypothetical protein
MIHSSLDSSPLMSACDVGAEDDDASRLDPLKPGGKAPDNRAPSGSGAIEYSAPPTYLNDALNDAERLLQYAAERGISVDVNIRNAVLHARAKDYTAWTEKTGADVLAALTHVAALVKPVTAESLEASIRDSSHAARTYWIVALCLAVLIIPASVTTFVTSAISNANSKDIVAANELAVKLTTQLEPPISATSGTAPTNGGNFQAAVSLPAGLSSTEIITELQTFASTVRTIDTRTRQLNRFVFFGESDPFGAMRTDPKQLKEKLQLPVPLPPDLSHVANDRIQVYQDVRSFAQSVGEDVTVFYGAFIACVLPVLYALLGTSAYLLRSFEQDMSNRTFTPSHTDSPRFLIAGIGGAVIGLFNNTFNISQGASIPPLAIAFLVGYAVDVFFSFLESLIQTFTKNRAVSNTSSAPQPSVKT